MLKRHEVVLLVMAGLLESFAISAQSVTDQNTVASSGPSEIQEIIVTARKREESILDVPVIEAAIPSQQIERTETIDFKDVAALVPGVILGDGAQSVGTDRKSVV